MDREFQVSRISSEAQEEIFNYRKRVTEIKSLLEFNLKQACSIEEDGTTCHGMGLVHGCRK